MDKIDIYGTKGLNSYRTSVISEGAKNITK